MPIGAVRDDSRVINDRYGTARASVAAGAADRDAHRHAFGAVDDFSGGARAAAITAAAADALRLDGMRVSPEGCDRCAGLVVDGHRSAVTAVTGLAADRHGNRDGHRRSTHAGRDRGRRCVSAIAAAPSHALGEDADRTDTRGDDRPIVNDSDRVAISRAAAVATDRNWDLHDGSDAECRGAAAISATAADALGEDAVRIIAADIDRTVVRDAHGSATAAIAAFAADRDGQGTQAFGRRVPAIAAAATNALREDAGRTITAGRKTSVVRDRHGAADPACPAAAANRDGGAETERCRVSAVAAAATHALRKNGIRRLTTDRNGPRGAVVHRH